VLVREPARRVQRGVERVDDRVDAGRDRQVVDVVDEQVGRAVEDRLPEQPPREAAGRHEGRRLAAEEARVHRDLAHQAGERRQVG
jgi:hypothetical protein